MKIWKVKCSLDCMAGYDALSLKSGRGNLRRVEILPYFDTHSMDWAEHISILPVWLIDSLVYYIVDG